MSLGIESALSRLVAQYVNQLSYRMPPRSNGITVNWEDLEVTDTVLISDTALSGILPSETSLPSGAI
jgi:hypothetical protein